MKSNPKLALVGLFILSFMLYRRLFLIRLPKNIIPTDDLQELLDVTVPSKHKYP